MRSIARAIRRDAAAPGHERGESLIELLVSVTLMGVALVAIISGITTAIVMSDVHRKQATAGTVLRNYAEAIQNMVTGGGYVACASATSYASPAGFTVPGGFSKSVVGGSMRYWSAGAWQSTCATDAGLQRLTVQVQSDDTRAVEQLVVVVRKPCRLQDPLCS